MDNSIRHFLHLKTWKARGAQMQVDFCAHFANEFCSWGVSLTEELRGPPRTSFYGRVGAGIWSQIDTYRHSRGQEIGMLVLTISSLVLCSSGTSHRFKTVRLTPVGFFRLGGRTISSLGMLVVILKFCEFPFSGCMRQNLISASSLLRYFLARLNSLLSSLSWAFKALSIIS